jgi:hypothetical protein
VPIRQDTRDSPDKRQEEPFDQMLPHEPAAAGAQREPQRRLTGPEAAVQ